MSRPSLLLSPGVVTTRAGVATAEIVGFSAFAHWQAEGHLPALDQLLLVALAVFGGSVLMLLGRVRVWSVVTVATVLQGGLHFLYADLASAPMPHHGSALPDTAANGLMPSRHMVVAHAVTAVVTVLVLIAQEQAVRRLVEVVKFEFKLVEVRSFPEVRRPVVPAFPIRLDVVLIAPRRGPPAVGSALTP